VTYWKLTLVSSNVLGYFYTKAIRPWLLRILEFSFVESGRAPTLGLHEGRFGPQPIKFVVHENFAWNPTTQDG